MCPYDLPSSLCITALRRHLLLPALPLLCFGLFAFPLSPRATATSESLPLPETLHWCTLPVLATQPAPLFPLGTFLVRFPWPSYLYFTFHWCFFCPLPWRRHCCHPTEILFWASAPTPSCCEDQLPIAPRCPASLENWSQLTGAALARKLQPLPHPPQGTDWKIWERKWLAPMPQRWGQFCNIWIIQSLWIKPKITFLLNFSPLTSCFLHSLSSKSSPSKTNKTI